MTREKTSPIVPLIEKQADRTACAETECELDAILANDKLLRCAVSQDLLRRASEAGFPDVSGEDSVAGAPRRKGFQEIGQPPLLRVTQAPVGLREQEVAEAIHVPTRPVIRLAVDEPARVCLLPINQGRPQRQPGVRVKIHGHNQRQFIARCRMLKCQFLCVQTNPLVR